MHSLSLYCHTIRAEVISPEIPGLSNEGWVEITLNQDRSDQFKIQLWNTLQWDFTMRPLLSTRDIAEALEQPAFIMHMEDRAKAHDLEEADRA